MKERLSFEREIQNLGLETRDSSDKTYEQRIGRRLQSGRFEKEYDVEIEKEIEISSELLTKLTDLVFFARYPELKGKKIKNGGRRVQLEWNKIRNQLIKPSSAGTSTGLEIDLTVPPKDPQPDFSKTEDELGVWEYAIFHSNPPFKFGTEETVMPDRKPGSYVSLLSVKFDKPQLKVFIAKHLGENSRDKSKAGIDRNNWNQTRLLVQKHAYGHLEIYRRAAKNMEKMLRELFNRFLPLPTAKKPLALSKDKLDEYLKSLGEFLTAIVNLEFWEKTCEWEKKDYPELSNKINRAGAVFLPDGLKVDCGSKPGLPDVPVPPVPIRPK